MEEEVVMLFVSRLAILLSSCAANSRSKYGSGERLWNVVRGAELPVVLLGLLANSFFLLLIKLWELDKGELLTDV